MSNQINRKSFIIHKDSLDILDKLSDEQAGKLFKAIHFYQKKQEIPTLDFALDLVFTSFLNQFKRDDESYKITCEARKLAGSKGGKQKVANASICKQKVANLADSESDSNSDSKNNNESKNNNVNKNDNISNEYKSKRFIKPTLDEIKEYCLERNNNIDADKFMNYYEANGWKIGKNTMKDWKACIRTWEGNDKSKPTKTIIKPDFENPNYYTNDY